MRPSLIVAGIVAALVAAVLLMPPPQDQSGGTPVEGLPWQIEILPGGGSRVADLTIGSSTFHDARARFGADGEVAIVVAPGETGSLESYHPNATLGAITGKLILTADAPPETIAAMLQRAVKADYMRSSTKKVTLADEDMAAALAAPIRAIAFIPSVNLDEAMILQRFGTPGERLRVSSHAEHFLYPERGLDIILDSEGKELLQYVAPRDFARLRQPLNSQGAKP